MNAMVLCPGCNGQQRGYGFVMRAGGGCNLEAIGCFDCGGTGEVTQERADWMTEGRRMAEDRQRRDLSLREEARRRGMTAAELSAMENGRVRPVPPAEGC